MIRRLLRLTFRLGLLTGIGLALFKVLKGRRSASELGSPSADWAPPPVPNPNLPTTPPEPELIEPVMFEEIIEKKAAIRAVPDPAPDPFNRTAVRSANRSKCKSNNGKQFKSNSKQYHRRARCSYDTCCRRQT